jgi:hypothetical protein
MRTSIMRPSWPRTEDLAFEPELAPLALLDAALAVTVQALIARNPELLVQDPTHRAPPLAVAARNIVVLYRDLHDALDEYRALLPPPEDHASGADDIPF